MSYRTAVAANAVLACGLHHRLYFSPFKIQALLFLIQGWSLARHGRPAIMESPEAWPNGPVFENLYFRLARFGDSAVTDFLPSFQPSGNSLELLFPGTDDMDYWRMVEHVVDEFGRWSLQDLAAVCREEGGAWHRAKATGELLISDQSIQSFFRLKFDEYASFVRQATGGDGCGGGDAEGLLLPAGS